MNEQQKRVREYTEKRWDEVAAELKAKYADGLKKVLSEAYKAQDMDTPAVLGELFAIIGAMTETAIEMASTPVRAHPRMFSIIIHEIFEGLERRFGTERYDVMMNALNDKAKQMQETIRALEHRPARPGMRRVTRRPH